MSTKFFSSMMAIMLFALVASSFTIASKWEKLGERKVNFGLDRDEIQVGLKDGIFEALKFKVKRNAVDFAKVKVVYGNGEHDEIELRETIRGGGETRVIDLKGNKRVIDKVIFWYDSHNRKNIKAEVELWGKH